VPRAEILETLRIRFDASEFALGAEVVPDRLLDCLRTLRDHHGYRFYVCAVGVDRGEHFEVIHGVRNADSFEEFWVRVRVPKDAASVPSASLVYAGADWHEREIFDLLGVSFSGHPNLTRILMPDEYEGHPLRKDFAMDTPWGYRPATRGEGAGEGGG